MKCPNCGDPNGRHYVPPSCGEEGFFICKEIISYENEMRNMEWKLLNGKRILVNLDRIDAVVEHGFHPDRTVIIIGNEEWEIISPYDEVLKHIPSK